jgi:hypothetical protein
LPAYADSTAFVRIIHASPDIGTADIFVDGAKVLSSFPFGGTTDYVRIPTGPHKIQIALIGKGPNAAVLTQTLSVGSSVPYTVAATGTSATGLSLQVFTDNNLIASGQARVRIYHLSPDAGPLDVTTGGKTVITGLSYKQASNYLTLSAGAYTFTMKASQTNTTRDVPVTLKANTITSIFAIGMLNGTPALQFVTAQVAGIPNWPGTGSDPHAQVIQPPSAYFSSLTPWLVSLVLILSGIVATSYGLTALQPFARKRDGRDHLRRIP